MLIHLVLLDELIVLDQLCEGFDALCRLAVFRGDNREDVRDAASHTLDGREAAEDASHILSFLSPNAHVDGRCHRCVDCRHVSRGRSARQAGGWCWC